jgi:hypothetical protein
VEDLGEDVDGCELLGEPVLEEGDFDDDFEDCTGFGEGSFVVDFGEDFTALWVVLPGDLVSEEGEEGSRADVSGEGIDFAIIPTALSHAISNTI